jgi:hypothetical protein
VAGAVVGLELVLLVIALRRLARARLGERAARAGVLEGAALSRAPGPALELVAALLPLLALFAAYVSVDSLRAGFVPALRSSRDKLAVIDVGPVVGNEAATVLVVLPWTCAALVVGVIAAGCLLSARSKLRGLAHARQAEARSLAEARAWAALPGLAVGPTLGALLALVLLSLGPLLHATWKHAEYYARAGEVARAAGRGGVDVDELGEVLEIFNLVERVADEELHRGRWASVAGAALGLVIAGSLLGWSSPSRRRRRLVGADVGGAGSGRGWIVPFGGCLLGAAALAVAARPLRAERLAAWPEIRGSEVWTILLDVPQIEAEGEDLSTGGVVGVSAHAASWNYEWGPMSDVVAKIFREKYPTGTAPASETFGTSLNLGCAPGSPPDHFVPMLAALRLLGIERVHLLANDRLTISRPLYRGVSWERWSATAASLVAESARGDGETVVVQVAEQPDCDALVRKVVAASRSGKKVALAVGDLDEEDARALRPRPANPPERRPGAR